MSPDAANTGSDGGHLVITLDPGVAVTETTINQGTAIGQGSANGATPTLLVNIKADPNKVETIVSATDPFASTAKVADPAAGFCDYAGATPTRVSYLTGGKFEGSAATDPTRPMAPFYFPFVYASPLTTTGNAVGGQPPLIGLFDWRPDNLDEGVVAAESDDFGQTWYFMQRAFELAPDLTDPASGGYTGSATQTGCPAAVTANNGTDDGYGHASVLQLPGVNPPAGMFLYLLDRSAANVDVAPLVVTELTAASNKFPIWNTNQTGPGANDIKSIASALAPTPGAVKPVVVQHTSGLANPDGIMAVFDCAGRTPGRLVGDGDVRAEDPRRRRHRGDRAAGGAAVREGAVLRQGQPRPRHRPPRDHERRRDVHRPRRGQRAVRPEDGRLPRHALG